MSSINKVSMSGSLAYVLQLDLQGVKQQEAVLSRLVHGLEVHGSQVGEVGGRDGELHDLQNIMPVKNR